MSHSFKQKDARMGKTHVGLRKCRSTYKTKTKAIQVVTTSQLNREDKFNHYTTGKQ